MDLCLLNAEPAGFELGEHRRYAPSLGVVKRGEIDRLGRHCDDPRLGVIGVANDANIRADTLGGEADCFKVVLPELAKSPVVVLRDQIGAMKLLFKRNR